MGERRVPKRKDKQDTISLGQDRFTQVEVTFCAVMDERGQTDTASLIKDFTL